MVARVAPTKKQEGAGAYFARPKAHMRFINTGCCTLNCVIAGGVEGGWALGKMSNVIGDKSTGKTLLAIEACANFIKQYPKGKIKYAEAEAAFDQDYAEALGMPVDKIEFIPEEKDFDTVEDFYEDLDAFLDKLKPGQPALYILDSLDSLSSRAEMARKIDQASFGDGKAKMMSQLFRRLIRKLKKTDCHLMIISQIRDNIGAMFGDKTTRSGGHALDFYASQIIKLAHLKSLVATVKGTKRTTGIRIKAKCTKNKIALAQRSCEFVIRFGYGVENYDAGMEWLLETGTLKDELGISKAEAERLMDASPDWNAADYEKRSAEMESALGRAWQKIETSILPTRRKYAAN